MITNPLKKLKMKKFSPILLSLSLIMTFGVSAGTITFNDFSDLSTVQLNGSTNSINNPSIAPDNSSVLRLTDDLVQSGSAFLREGIALGPDTGFSTEFEFQITDPQGPAYNFNNYYQGGDGFTFAGVNSQYALGGAGGGIGYNGVTDSFAVEFDTWNSFEKDDNSGNHVGININGDLYSVVLTDLGSAPEEQLSNGTIWTAWVDYDGTTDLLSVRFSDTSTRPLDSILSYTVDLYSIFGSNCVHFGFTSATGSAANDHDIRSWSLAYDSAPEHVCSAVPEPSTFALIMTAMIALRLARTRRNS